MGNSLASRGAAAGVAVGLGLWSVSRGIHDAGAHVGRGIESAGLTAGKGLRHAGGSIASGLQDAGTVFGRDVGSGVKDIGCALLFFSLIGMSKWQDVSWIIS